MTFPQRFLRIFFSVLSLLFIAIFAFSIPTTTFLEKGMITGGLSLLVVLLFISCDLLFRQVKLRTLNSTLLGMGVGYLLGKAAIAILSVILEASHLTIALQPQTLGFIHIALFLCTLYLGTTITLRCADELHISLPFIKLNLAAQQKKDLLLDASILTDVRIIDLAATGLLDHQLVLPRFILKEFYIQAEHPDEAMKAKARRCLETLQKLQTTAQLELRFDETDFPEMKDSSSKLIRLARLSDANILTADASRLQLSVADNIRIINLHLLSNALKPLMQTKEVLSIKIQRFGKEPHQGVGYLEDGTMVVVNGGGNFIGETIESKVLSVKHTSSGRIIFCNTLEDKELSYSTEEGMDHGQS